MQSSDTPENVLANILAKLRATPKIDLELVGILDSYLLKVVPSPNAVNEARDAILNLAKMRAEAISSQE